MTTFTSKPGMNPGENRAATRAAMKEPLKVLIVEDSENDAALLELELQRAGYTPVCQRVDTRGTMAEALRGRRWDVVIADYVMPHFSGLDALDIIREAGLDLPFIVVSGHISDDTAVAAMKAGAHDYVMKDNLARLGPAVRRELREAEDRRQRRETDEALRVEQVFREAIEDSVPSGIAAVDLEGRQTYVNPAFCAMVGWSEQELLGARPPFVYWPPEDVEVIIGALAGVIQGHAPASGLELRFRNRGGEYLHVLLQITPLKDSFGNITGWVSSASDITERKRAETRLAAEHAVTRILSGAQSLAEAAPGILQVLIGALDVDFGALWVKDPAGERLLPSVLDVRASTPPLREFLEETRKLAFPPGTSVPGRVWRQRSPIWIEDTDLETQFDRHELAVRTGLRSALAFPILGSSEFFGVFEFFTLRRFAPDSALANMLTAIGLEIGQFIHRWQAEEGLRRAHDELEIRVQQRTEQLKTANTRLQTSITERRRLEQELLEITEKERRRIGLDLHDDLGQKLSGIALMSKGLELKLARAKSSEARDAAQIHNLIQEAMSHASDLAHDLATLDVAEKDLPSALEHLAARVRELFQISCKFSVEGPIPALDAATVTQVYKIAQEAVTNAFKHGKASRVQIGLAGGSDKFVLTVRNNGLPFPDLRGPGSTGMGLRIMHYRASLIGGTLEIKAQGSHGTLLTCAVPVELAR